MAPWLGDILGKRIVSGTWKKGSIVELAPDLVIAHDIAFPLAAQALHSMGVEKVINPERIFVVQDHLQPAKDRMSADMAADGQKFAIEKGIRNFLTVGGGGILTVALDELTRLRPGMLIAGTDTHMPTYGAFGIMSVNIGAIDLAQVMYKGTFWFESPPTLCIHLDGQLDSFVGGRDIGLWLLKQISMDGGLGEYFLLEGSIVDSFSICSRRQLCNLMVEAGAVGSFMRADKTAAAYLGIEGEPLPELAPLECDATYTYDVTGLEPQVALPGRPDDVHPVSEIKPVDVDAVFIGSCAGGSIEDLMAVDEVLRSNKIHDRVRLIIVPQSAGTLKEAERLGIVGRMAGKGAYIAGPGCGPCMGAHIGVLGRGEVCVSTSPRNFQGRMGSKLADVYLANAWVAAAAAVAGTIVHPKEVLK